jgi:hypothetical protein
MPKFFDLGTPFFARQLFGGPQKMETSTFRRPQAASGGFEHIVRGFFIRSSTSGGSRLLWVLPWDFHVDYCHIMTQIFEFFRETQE